MTFEEQRALFMTIHDAIPEGMEFVAFVIGENPDNPDGKFCYTMAAVKAPAAQTIELIRVTLRKIEEDSLSGVTNEEGAVH